VRNKQGPHGIIIPKPPNCCHLGAQASIFYPDDCCGNPNPKSIGDSLDRKLAIIRDLVAERQVATVARKHSPSRGDSWRWRFNQPKVTISSRPKLNCGRRRCFNALVPVCESEVTRIGIAIVGSQSTETVFASFATRPHV
jgi:hypothetical protein